MKGSRILSLVILVALFYFVGYQLIWKWGVCRVYVNQGESLMVRYRGNLLWPSPPMAQGDFAKVDESGRPLEIGILKEMLGPGRHFIDPIHYERQIVEDIVILPGQVGVVTSKFGKDLPSGEFLVDGDVGETEYKGILRKVLKPGRYRINRFGYEVKVEGSPEKSTIDAEASPEDTEMANLRQRNRQSVLSRLSGKRANWVVIPPGYVGVVTNLANDPKRKIHAGIQNEVLQPGIYAINPREQQVDIISIGYTGITIKADLETDSNGRLKMDENGEPIVMKNGDPGINFPSNDGFPISLDFTGIWGIMPNQAARIVSLFGNLDAVETTVIIPEIESICRIHGSKLGAVDLLTGDSREMFQREVSEDFRRVLSEKNISLQVGLVRHIYIPPQVRGPIQKANIADEMKLTRDMEIETAKVEADLEEARASVTKEENKVTVETEKMYQEAMALGRKKVEELHAQTEKLVAAIAKETAEIESEAKLVLGEAEAKVETMRQEAEAQRFALAVDAFGSPEAYNQWVFANGLPEDIKLTLLYAGPGTFWTDLKGFQEAAMGKLLEAKTAGTETIAKPRPATPKNQTPRNN
ncbi:MAG: SPFH domain-containing protein [Planctomycetota bacterium]